MVREYIFRNFKFVVYDVSEEAGTLKPKVRLITNEAKKVGRIHQIQYKGQNLDKEEKDTEVAISIRGLEIGKDIGKDETLFVSLPESHVRQLMARFLNELTSDQKDALREYIQLRRKYSHPWWGM